MSRRPFLLAVLSLASGAAAQTQWWVSPTGSNANPGTQASPFQTINHAASVATAGDIIRLIAATYGDEQGSVLLGTKNLTVRGAGVGLSIVKAHTSANLLLPAGLLASPTMDTHRCSIAIQGSARLTLRDMTLDNGFSVPPSGRAYSLWIGSGADVTVDHVECINARTNPLNGIQGPLGVNIRGDGGADQTQVTLSQCTIREYGKGGVVANFNAHLIMDDCTVDGAGHVGIPLPAQNGIQVSRGATCELRRCRVTDHWYDPATVVASGILLFDSASPTIIEDCEVGNTQMGIISFGTPAVISGLIRRNRVHTAEYGIYFDNISGFTVTGNSFAVSNAGDNDDAWDDIAGNTWSGNYYSALTANGSYNLPGTAAANDATAKALMVGFGANSTTSLPAGHAPIDLATANLDGDTDSDFAALCQTATTPALAIGLNSGGVFSVTSVPFGSAAGSPVAIVSGEFNGAAGRDLAVVTCNIPPALTENKVYVFANNGSGVFSLLHTHSLVGATSPSGIAAGNLDAGSVNDLAVSDAGSAGFVPGSASALLNNGTGTAFIAVPLLAAYAVACRDATIGDLNGDTFADIAVTEGDAGTGKAHLFQGNGLGAFVAMAGSPITVSANVSQALASDVDLDGDVDLLTSASIDPFGLVPGGVDVLANAGGGTFTGTLYRVDRGPTAIVAGDLDADADPDTLRPDVAVLNFAAGSVSILGGWARAGAATGGIAVAGTTASGIGLADVDGDGFTDLLYCDAAAGTVVTRLAVPQARADSYGAGSAGTGAVVPNLYPVGAPALPVIGNATFGLGLRRARPFSIAVIAAGVNPAPITPFGILIGDIGATWAVVTTFGGTSAVPLPVPGTLSLAGADIYAQAGVFDSNGSETFFPGLALTNGLKIRVGF